MYVSMVGLVVFIVFIVFSLVVLAMHLHFLVFFCDSSLQ